jgi:hypothetical protein
MTEREKLKDAGKKWWIILKFIQRNRTKKCELG